MLVFVIYPNLLHDQQTRGFVHFSSVKSILSVPGHDLHCSHFATLSCFSFVLDHHCLGNIQISILPYTVLILMFYVSLDRHHDLSFIVTFLTALLITVDISFPSFPFPPCYLQVQIQLFSNNEIKPKFQNNKDASHRYDNDVEEL